MAEALGGIGFLIALPVGIFVYFFRRWWDRNRMRQSMARILHVELSVNTDILIWYKINGMDRDTPMYDDVYKGLLTSGNIHYLPAYQYRLHSLYSSLRHNDKNRLKLFTAIMDDLSVIMDCPFGRLCQLSPVLHIRRTVKALRRRKGRRG